MSLVVQSTRNGALPVTGYREDLAAGDFVIVSLVDPAGAGSARWELFGRPEGSKSGGAGPEPILLGQGPAAGFLVDVDDDLSGTYLIRCTVAPGSSAQQVASVALVKTTGFALSDGRTLRYPSWMESEEDTGSALVSQGYGKALNRWLRKLADATAGAVAPSWSNYRQQWAVIFKNGGPNADYMYSLGNHWGGGPVGRAGVAASVLYAHPFPVVTTTQVQGFNNYSTFVGTMPGPGKCWFAIYDNEPASLYPRNRVWDGEAIAPNAEQDWGLLVNHVLTPGLYWFAFVYDANAGGHSTHDGIPTQQLFPWMGYPADVPAAGIYAGGMITHAYAYARPPATFPTATPSYLNVADGVNKYPAMRVRYRL